MANHHIVSLAVKVTKKTDTRIVAEAYLRRIASLIGMVYSTRLISVPEDNLDIHSELKRLPVEIQLIMDAVAEARGTPVYPVKPHNLYSLDDTTQYIFAGLSTVKEDIRMTLTESVRASGINSLWIPDQGNAMKGMRVDMTFGFSGAGTSMPIVACVSGLSEKELPGADFLVLEVPGSRSLWRRNRKRQ